MERQEKDWGQASATVAVGVGNNSQCTEIEIEPQNDFPRPSAPPLPPPSYEEALAAPSVPPPSFDSLFSQIKNARETSEGLGDFWSKLNDAIGATVAVIVVFFMCLGLLLAISVMIGMVVIGAMHFHECPVQPKIPIMLILGGSVLLILNIVNCVRRKPRNDTGPNNELSTKGMWFTFLFLLWLVLSSYWVYSELWPSPNPEDPGYCNPQLYSFFYWLLNVTNVMIVLACLC